MTDIMAKTENIYAADSVAWPEKPWILYHREAKHGSGNYNSCTLEALLVPPSKVQQFKPRKYQSLPTREAKQEETTTINNTEQKALKVETQFRVEFCEIKLWTKER